MHELRDSVLPDAGAVIETDQSVARALERVANVRARGLLVLGSSPGAPLGRVRVDNRTRELLGQAQSAVAVAPRGLSVHDPRKLRVIGVACDRKPEAREALKFAASLARAAGAKLRVASVLDDRVPSAARSMREDTELAAAAAATDAEITVTPGAPAESLLALSEAVDLVFIGSSALELSNRCALGALPGRCCMTLAAQRLSDPPCASRPKRPRTFDRGGPPAL